jgi:ABC-type lipoprotein export system ATPase subunit
MRNRRVTATIVGDKGCGKSTLINPKETREPTTTGVDYSTTSTKQTHFTV